MKTIYSYFIIVVATTILSSCSSTWNDKNTSAEIATQSSIANIEQTGGSTILNETPTQKQKSEVTVSNR